MRDRWSYLDDIQIRPNRRKPMTKPNNQLIVIEPDGTYRLIDNRYVEIRNVLSPFDFATLPGSGTGAYIGDESLLTGELFNFIASLVVGRPLWGTAILAAAQPDEDGETLPPDKRVLPMVEGYSTMWNMLWQMAAAVGQVPAARANAGTVPPPTMVEIGDFNDFLKHLSGEA
jgi:hypothetical protein